MNKFYYLLIFIIVGCNSNTKNSVLTEMTAEKLLGNPKYQAICYGGYRTNTRAKEPSVAEIKEDLKILAALDIKMIRTYNVHQQETKNLLQAISELHKASPQFEMYVMLGAWIDCKNAWTNQPPIHDQESERNAAEINEAVRLAQQYPQIVKIISVGNEAMVKWAISYYVTPGIILKWVNHLQELKRQKQLPSTLWITSSDNFASWGGGDASYHVAELSELMRSVDYISMHTYPMHDTHYNPVFWKLTQSEQKLAPKEKVLALMKHSRDYAVGQYNSVVGYMKSLGINKPVHIGETGWATHSNEYYGDMGSQATDEYKAALYYQLMRQWSNQSKVSCFYFEAFDENWKDSSNPEGSENHFGLINLDSQAKYVLWNEVDKGTFSKLTRNGKPISKTFNGKEELLWEQVKMPNEMVLDNPR